MSTYRFKVSDPAEIDIPRICRENKDQDAFVVLYSDRILYVLRENLAKDVLTWHTKTPGWSFGKIMPPEHYEGFVFGWDYHYSDLETTFFKKVAEALEKQKKKKVVTVIAKD